MDDFQTTLKEALTKRFTEQRNIGILIGYCAAMIASKRIANKMNKKEAIEYFNTEAERIQKKLEMDGKTLEAMDAIEDIVDK
ncbi:MAG TPA: hypothetical protein DCW90_15860 [Lachnospiraceae bacterium]|nr:hypothetical protein [Lachnospiraceae bacterium]